MAKKQQRFTQRPTVFEPTEAEIDAVLADVFEAERLAREQHALEMDASEVVWWQGVKATARDGSFSWLLDEQQPDGLSERAQVVEDAVREDVERQNDEKHCENQGSSSSRRRWRRIIDIDAPIPYKVVAFDLTDKARAALEMGL